MRNARAFTLIELIVAVSLTVLMMFLIGQIFTQTRRTISRGTGTADVLANSRAMSSQLVMDFDQMLGPHDNSGRMPEQSGGVLIITYQRLGDWIAFDGILAGDSNGDGKLTPDEGDVLGAPEGILFQTPNAQLERRFVRTDQLAFIASRRPGQQPITPAGPDSFTPYNDDRAARNLIVTYGHAARANRDGSDFDGNPSVDTPTLAGHLGRAGANTEGNRFILGRHALFLGEDSPPAGVIHTTTPSHRGTVASGYSPLSDDGVWMGLTDYADVSFDDPARPALLVGDAAPAFLEAQPGTVLPSQIDDYAEAALDLAFTRKRMRVNPQPEAGAEWESWRVAQAHAYFMEYASDFIVEIAGDYETEVGDGFAQDGQVDTLGTDVSGTDSRGVAYSYPANTIRWYVPVGFDNSPDAAFFDSSKPLTWALPSIPVGYDPAVDGSKIAPLPHADAAFVFRHDDEGGKFTGDPAIPSLWPHLLRIRYRLHDPRGELMSGSGHHGIWFEQVVAVSRPTR